MSTPRALVPEFASSRVWSYAKSAASQTVVWPSAGLEELRAFAMACDGRAQWTVYGRAVLSFTYLLRVGEAALIRRGASRSRGLGFHTIKCDLRFIWRKLGRYGRAWLRWLDVEGATSAIPLALFCPQGSAYLYMVMAAALNGCVSPHKRWHAWRPSTSRLHCAMTQKSLVILGSPTSLSTGTPNFLTNVSSHSFLRSNNTHNAILTVQVARAILMRGTESIKEEQIRPLAKAAKPAADISADRVCT